MVYKSAFAKDDDKWSLDNEYKRIFKKSKKKKSKFDVMREEQEKGYVY